MLNKFTEKATLFTTFTYQRKFFILKKTLYSTLSILFAAVEFALKFSDFSSVF